MNSVLLFTSYMQMENCYSYGFFFVKIFIYGNGDTKWRIVGVSLRALLSICYNKTKFDKISYYRIEIKIIFFYLNKKI